MDVVDKIEQRIEHLGYDFPDFVKSAGNYILVKRVGKLLFLSGVTCKVNGNLMTKGKLGDEVTIEDAQKAVKICVLNHLRILKDYLNNLEEVDQVVRFTGYVNCVNGYPNIPIVIDAGSNILIDIFGERGKHVRSAIGVESLPGNATIETELIATLMD